MLKWTAIGLAGAAALLFAGVILFVGVERAQVARSLAIDPARGIDVLEDPVIGCVRQWVQIRGRDRDNPVVLFVHGGPGIPMMPLAHLFQSAWEAHFTVAQWDQRGAGRSRRDRRTGAAISPGASIEVYVRDAAEVARHVSARTGHARIGVIGHSWGSLVALRAVKQYPELFFAYVGTGQMIDFAAQERAGFEFAWSRAAARGDLQTLQELRAIAPYPESMRGADGRGRLELMMTSRAVVAAHQGVFAKASLQSSLVLAPFTSPAYGVADAIALMRGTDPVALLGSALFDELLAARFDTEALQLQVPALFILGRHDYTTASEVMAARFADVTAPAKGLYWLEHSAHFPMLEQPDEFLRLLVQHARPLERRD